MRDKSFTFINREIIEIFESVMILHILLWYYCLSLLLEMDIIILFAIDFYTIAYY